MKSHEKKKRITKKLHSQFGESSEKKKRITKKLHCQFGHSSAEKLKKLLKLAHIWDQELNRN